VAAARQRKTRADSDVPAASRVDGRDDLATAVELEVIAAALPEQRFFLCGFGRRSRVALGASGCETSNCVTFAGFIRACRFPALRKALERKWIRYLRRVGFGRGGIDAFFKSGASAGV
jgi:hypothetical protein